MVREVRSHLPRMHQPPESDRDDDIPEIKKQISLFFPITDFTLIRNEAIRRRITMAELVRDEWIESHLKTLRNPPEKAA